MTRPFFLLIVSLFFTGIAPKSQAQQPLPASFQGYWAHPECSDYTEGVVLTRYFYLKSTEEKSVFRIARLIAEKQDYKIISLGPEKHPVLHSEDSLLRIGTIEKGGGWSAEWDALPLLGRNEYTGCAEVPTVIPVPLARLMKQIDRIFEACGAEKTACGDALFALADTNGNKRLSMAEFKKTGAIAATFMPLLEKDGVPTPDLEAAYLQGIGDGQALGEILLAAQDKDRSRDLSRQEMAEALDKPLTPALTRAREVLGRVFAGLKL